MPRAVQLEKMRTEEQKLLLFSAKLLRILLFIPPIQCQSEPEQTCAPFNGNPL
jgi:hypothetical protein